MAIITVIWSIFKNSQDHLQAAFNGVWWSSRGDLLN